jgi:hypothetical protein
MKFLLTAAVCVFFACTSSDKAKSFTEGTIQYRITYEKGVDKNTANLMASGLTVKLKKDRLHLKFKGGFAEMKAPVIIDMAKQEALYLNSFDSTVLPKALSGMDYGKDFKKSGQGETILGYNTTRYEARHEKKEYVLDVADAIPARISNTIILEGFYLSSFEGLPLQVKIKEGELWYTYKAESIRPEAIPDSAISIPKGFKIRRP